MDRAIEFGGCDWRRTGTLRKVANGASPPCARVRGALGDLGALRSGGASRARRFVRAIHELRGAAAANASVPGLRRRGGMCGDCTQRLVVLRTFGVGIDVPNG